MIAYDADSVTKDLVRIARSELAAHFPDLPRNLNGDSLRISRLPEAISDCKFSLMAKRAWMFLIVDYIATKKIIAPALNTMVGGPSKVFRGFARPDRGSDSCTGEARDQERRHTQGPRPG